MARGLRLVSKSGGMTWFSSSTHSIRVCFSLTADDESLKQDLVEVGTTQVHLLHLTTKTSMAGTT